MANPTVFNNAFLGVSTATGAAANTHVTGLKAVTAPISRAELADAVMGDDIAAVYPGILSAPVSASYRNDFATASTGVDKKFYNLLANKTPVRIKLRPVNTTVSGPNPSTVWTRVCVTAITPVMGQHGELLQNNVEFRPMSGCTLIRSTST